METSGSPPYCTLHGGHTRTPPVRLRVDAWGGFARAREEESGHRSDSPRESGSACGWNVTSLFSQFLDVAEGLTYLHSSNVIHGDLKGVCHITHL